jgi:F1F0 ATPase subunit 2
MTAPTLGIAAQVAIGFLAGFILGVLHFASLWWNTRLFATGSAGKAFVLQLARIAVAVSVLVLLARFSLVALLSGAVAFLLARPLLLWRFGELR